MYNSICEHRGGIFFLDAPGGTRKIFIKLLLAKVRQHKGIALDAASLAIAATLLPGKRTAHSAFKHPFNTLYSTRQHAASARMLTKLRLYEDINSSSVANVQWRIRDLFEALHQALKDIRCRSCPIGGVSLLISGDFRQTYPGILNGTRSDAVIALIKSSSLYQHVQTLKFQT